MQLMLTTIHVNDLEESLEFYQNVLNLAEVKRLSPRPGVEISFLQDEGGMIELIAGEEATKDESRVSIGFEVEDMEAVIEELEAKGVDVLRGPIKTTNGTKLLFIEDPNGVEIEFIENLTL